MAVTTKITHNKLELLVILINILCEIDCNFPNSYEGQDEVVEILIQNGANVDEMEPDWNTTSLYHTARIGYFKNVETLLKHGAQKHFKTSSNMGKMIALEVDERRKDSGNSNNGGKTPSQIAETDYNQVFALLENN